MLGRQARSEFDNYVTPLANSELRKRILTIRRSYDLPYDEHTPDLLLSVEARDMSLDAAQTTVTSWRQ